MKSKFINKITDILVWLPIVVLVVIFFVPVILIYIITYPFSWIVQKRFNKRYNEFLLSLESKNFFCYNNKRSSFNYINEEVLPYLPKSVDVLFLKDRIVYSDRYEPKFTSQMFYDFKNYKGFPQLVKIRDGVVYDCSINNELFNSLNQGKDKQIIFDKMNEFFELK